MTRYIYILAALFSVACAAKLEGRIASSSPADGGQFPHQVALHLRNKFYCSGSILNEEWIVTSAYCVVLPSSISDLTVVAGTNSLSSGGDTYKVSYIVPHRDFNIANFHNDIVLMRLDSPISFNEKVQPIALETEFVGAGEDLVLSGWGHTSTSEDYFNDLQFLHVKSISNSECDDHYNNMGLIDKTQLCTFTRHGGACEGDTGGPLTHNGKLAGIISWGSTCDLDFPNIFTRVSAYVDWINDYIN